MSLPLPVALLAAASFLSFSDSLASAQGCRPAPPGLIRWWSADGHSDDLISDNDGSTGTFAAGATSSALDQSFRFDGSGGDRINLTGTSDLAPVDAVTVAVWLKVGSLPPSYMTAYDHLGGNTGFGMSIRGNGHAWFTLNGGLGDAEGVSNLDDGQWHHVVGTYNRISTQVHLFVDGNLEASSPYGQTLQYGIHTRHGIGGSSNSLGSQFRFHGDVDELMVFNRALSTNEVRLLGAIQICEPCGTTLCTGVANSTGSPSTLCAVGSPVAATNVLTLVASGLPIQSTVLFVVSMQTGFTANPGGSEGNLCLGSGIGRFLGPGQVTGSGASGTTQLALDLTQVPQPNAPIAATTGDTFHFQAWHRDIVAGAATSNFSSGLSVTLR